MHFHEKIKIHIYYIHCGVLNTNDDDEVVENEGFFGSIRSIFKSIPSPFDLEEKDIDDDDDEYVSHADDDFDVDIDDYDYKSDNIDNEEDDELYVETEEIKPIMTKKADTKKSSLKPHKINK